MFHPTVIVAWLWQMVFRFLSLDELCYIPIPTDLHRLFVPTTVRCACICGATFPPSQAPPVPPSSSRASSEQLHGGCSGMVALTTEPKKSSPPHPKSSQRGGHRHGLATAMTRQADDLFRIEGFAANAAITGLRAFGHQGRKCSLVDVE